MKSNSVVVKFIYGDKNEKNDFFFLFWQMGFLGAERGEPKNPTISKRYFSVVECIFNYAISTHSIISSWIFKTY